MLLSPFTNQRILLLQGPIGPFFSRLATELELNQCTVFKLNFNGGDVLFYPKGDIFSEKMSNFTTYLKKYLINNQINVVMVFGDCRPIHQLAKAVVTNLGLDWFVFEEGYLRPNHITLEKGGVNGFSELPFKAQQFIEKQTEKIYIPPIHDVGRTFWYAMLWAMLYYFFSTLLQFKFKHYVHHRKLSILEAWPWIRSGIRKYWFKFKERGIEHKLTHEYALQYFLVPLQTFNDAQISHHSNFLHIEEFIEHCIDSFTQYAPPNMLLVFKQHPFDRGYKDYHQLIKKKSSKSHLAKKVLYIHDQYLPDLIEHSAGVVVINSTVGMSAVEQFKPVKVCGQAVYDLANITYQGDLNSFWTAAKQWKVQSRKIDMFLTFLTHSTQYNGSFYRKIRHIKTPTGIAWHSLRK